MRKKAQETLKIKKQEVKDHALGTVKLKTNRLWTDGKQDIQEGITPLRLQSCAHFLKVSPNELNRRRYYRTGLYSRSIKWAVNLSQRGSQAPLSPHRSISMWHRGQQPKRTVAKFETELGSMSKQDFNSKQQQRGRNCSFLCVFIT